MNFWLEILQLWKYITEHKQAGGINPEKNLGKWSVLPYPLTVAWPHSWALTVIFLPNWYINRRGEINQFKTLQPHRTQSKERNPYKAGGKKNTFCATIVSEKKCVINNWKRFQISLNTVSRNWSIIGIFFKNCAARTIQMATGLSALWITHAKIRQHRHPKMLKLCRCSPRKRKLMGRKVNATLLDLQAWSKII